MAYAPGIWSEEQTAAWIPIADAVHRAGGKISAQLWHMGRTVHPDFPDGNPPVSASATPAAGQAHTYSGKQDYAPARALSLAEIGDLIEDFRHGARKAKVAGFDGVEIHAANGHLPDQFLRDGTNLRTDRYGGSIENRSRFLCEVTEAVAGVYGADRTAVRFSPDDGAPGAPHDSNPEALFRASSSALSEMRLAFLELPASRPNSSFRAGVRDLAPMVREMFDGPLVLNPTIRAKARSLRSPPGRPTQSASAGRSSPIRTCRAASSSACHNDGNIATWYSQGVEGYIDYPFYSKAVG